MSKQPRITKAQQRKATIHSLIAISREMFTAHGFANTALEDIVQMAGVTRGALYHHFGSKEGLFRAVLEAVQTDVAHQIETAADAQESLWDQLVAGCNAFLEACADPSIQRILLVDAPSVLGWDVWRETDMEHSGRLLENILSELMEHGLIKPLSVPALTQALSGAMNELAIWIAQTPHPALSLDDASTTLSEILNGLKQAE